jgi:hypothetical protein
MTEQPPPTLVRVVDLDIPFGSMVFLMLKWMLAAIPALLCLAILWALLMGSVGLALFR